MPSHWLREPATPEQWREMLKALDYSGLLEPAPAAGGSAEPRA